MPRWRGEKAALERRVEALEGEKRAVQGQMNMLMISSSDSENRLHELEAELSELREGQEAPGEAARRPGRRLGCRSRTRGRPVATSLWTRRR